MKPKDFSIRSSASDRELAFVAKNRDHFIVELRGLGLSVTREVYAYTDAHGLSRFFSKLASFDRPWAEAESWASLEDEFRITAVCSALGQVRFTVAITSLVGGSEEWRVSASLMTGLGQLPGIAADARVFFDVIEQDIWSEA